VESPVGKFPDSTTLLFPSSPDASRKLRTPASYHVFPDCGASLTPANPADKPLDIGLDCEAEGGLPNNTTDLVRIFFTPSPLPFHRCLKSTSPGQWSDACPKSQFQSETGYPLSDPNLKTLLTYQTQSMDVPTMSEYLFLVTNENTSKIEIENTHLLRKTEIPYLNNAVTTTDQYNLVTNPTETAFDYPLCVLQRSIGP